MANDVFRIYGKELIRSDFAIESQLSHGRQIIIGDELEAVFFSIG